MDLQDYDGKQLYFEEPIPETVENLLDEAAEAYASGGSEVLLLRAFFEVPDNLTVLVALYRTYYYRHRLEDARKVVQRALAISGDKLDFPEDWRELNLSTLSKALLVSMGMVRFYLLALKAEGFLCLRLGELDEGKERLRKVSDLDEADRLGARALLKVVDGIRLVQDNERAGQSRPAQQQAVS